jgi:polyhydroxybutyrate depolymerase
LEVPYSWIKHESSIQRTSNIDDLCKLLLSFNARMLPFQHQLPAVVVPLIVLLLITVVPFTEAQIFRPKPRPEGFVQRSLMHDGLERWYVEYRPESYVQGNPVVLFLHGAGGSMNGIATRKDVWVKLSNENGFLLLAPNGIGRENGNDTKGSNQPWNDLLKNAGTVDDVGFLASLVAWAKTERGVNPAKVYMVGVSNGGMMTYRVVIETSPPLYAAVASFIGNLPADDVPKPNSSTPIFMMMGTKDKIIQYEGGSIGPRFGSVRSAAATRDFWLQVNQADVTNVQKTMLPNRCWFDFCRISSEFYPAAGTAMTRSAPVHFYTMEGGGHMIPYTDFDIYPLPKRLRAGPPCREAVGEILAWNFISQYEMKEA